MEAIHKDVLVHRTSQLLLPFAALLFFLFKTTTTTTTLPSLSDRPVIRASVK